ncbi:hypothetical protein BaRGS_00028939 [Batillaria attramentaria]|uniref:SH3 domain-containing protein n=1 Tax=Batillaria attramentaria TaxID=370345 RepID=A0ABD0JYL9_9CAEN
MEAAGVYEYVVRHRYNPQDHQHDDSYIPIDPGDRLEVTTPLEMEPTNKSMEEPQGWLKGHNVTKDVTGLFPGHPFVKLVRSHSQSSLRKNSLSQSQSRSRQKQSDWRHSCCQPLPWRRRVASLRPLCGAKEAALALRKEINFVQGAV